MDWRILIFAVVISGCSTGTGVLAPVANNEGDTGQTLKLDASIPPGIEKSIADRGSSLADSSFVSIADEEEASEYERLGLSQLSQSDSLWAVVKGLDAVLDSLEIANSEQDSVATATPATDSTAVIMSPNAGFHLSTDTTTLRRDSLTVLVKALLGETQSNLESSIQLNPFNLDPRLFLAQLHKLWAVVFQDENAVDRAIEVLEFISDKRHDEHHPIAELAAIYVSRSNWMNAATAYSRAEQVLLDAYTLRGDTTMTGADSSSWFEYAFYQGDAFRKLYDAGAALDAYGRARLLTRNDLYLKNVKDWVEFINWDDGNIAGGDTRDSLALLVNEGKLPEAEQGFTELLLHLQTQRARDEIEWRLAIVESQLQKSEQASDRLNRLVERTEVEAGTGLPLDTVYVQYFDAFGELSYSLGDFYATSKRDPRTAMKYYDQATRVQWHLRGRAFLKAATIARNRRVEAVDYAERGLKYDLSDSDRRKLYRLLVDLYRIDNQEMARYYTNLIRNM